jgi:sialic acid synthase SpsE
MIFSPFINFSGSIRTAYIPVPALTLEAPSRNIWRSNHKLFISQNYSTRIAKMVKLAPLSPHRTYVIAEMACSHEGDPGLARKIIDAAAEAQADAIQFQIWLAKDLMVPHHADYSKLLRLELSRETWAELAEHARARRPEMEIIACVYERGSVDFGEELKVDAYKLHSADLSNPDLVKYVAATGKRIDLSVGASSLAEIQSAIEWIRETSDSRIWLMYGYQNFPTPTDGVHLDYMMKLRDLFELPIGYQDHSDAETGAAFWLPAAAVGMGVDILEKHLTHDRSQKGIDHEAALNPDEFARFVGMVREIELARGYSSPRAFSAEEIRYRKYSKKSLVAGGDLPAGKTLELKDLVVRRADQLGLPPDKVDRLIGRVMKRGVAAHHLVTEDDVV